MIKYQVEKLKDIQVEIEPLLEAHYLEVHAFIEEGILLSPDWAKYFVLEDIGMIHTVTVRDGDELVGYYISSITSNLHYKEHLYANNDVLYVKEELRNTGVAVEMFSYAEKCYRELGVSVMTIHMKDSKPFTSLCKALAMKKIESTYGKYVGAV
jgi:GNAT superfamily N-acetyltransferase